MFFVFGSPRSGTTLLAQCLSANDDIIIPNETDFIIPLAFTFDRIQDPELCKEMVARFVTESLTFKNSFGEYTTKEELRELIYSCPHSPSQMIKAVYSHLAAKDNKKIGGDKSPNDLLFLRMLIKVGGISPDMKIIHIIRDVRDVMLSICNSNFGGEDITVYFARFWSNSNLYLYDLYKNKPEQYIIVRYEDLVSNPERHIKEISRFLGVEYQEKMLSPASRHDRYKGLKIHENLYKPISTGRVGAYKGIVGQKDLALYVAQAREALEVFGYEKIGRLDT